MATGSIRKLSNTKDGRTRYQVTVEGGTDPDTGERIRKFQNVIGSKRDAEKVKHQLISAMESSKAIHESEIPVSKWMDEWLSTYVLNIEETTRIGYENIIKNHVKPTVGNIRLKALTTRHVQDMVNGMITQGLAPKTIREAYNNLNAAMKKAKQLRMINVNPCEAVELPKQKRYQGSVYDVSQMQNLLTVAKDTDMYLPLLILTSAGLRRGELIGLKWSDVDFVHNVLHIRHNVVRGRNGSLEKAPKSQSGIRDIPMGNDVMSELRKAFTLYQARCAKDESFHDYGVVIAQNDGTPYRPDSMTQKWERFIQANHLPSIRLHDLRHSNATALIQAGVNAKVVQQRLGHSDVTTTLNTYAHVLPEMNQAAADTIDHLLEIKKA